MSLQNRIKQRVDAELAGLRKEREECQIREKRLESERKKLLQKRKAHMSQWLELPSDFSVVWVDGKGKDCENNEYRVSAVISYQGVEIAVDSTEKLLRQSGRHNEASRWVFKYFSTERMKESEWEVKVESGSLVYGDAEWKTCASKQELHKALEDGLVRRLVYKGSSVISQGLSFE